MDSYFTVVYLFNQQVVAGTHFGIKIKKIKIYVFQFFFHRNKFKF